MSTNVQPTLNTPKNSRRRSFLGATGLVAKSLTKVVDLPGLREPVRAAQDIATALKAPKNNDAKAQELMGRIDDILRQIKFSNNAGHGELESEEWRNRYPEHCRAAEKLEEIKVALATVKARTYTAKLARQNDIEQFLSSKEQELQMVIQDFYVS
ncbi:hypothetical protein RSOL_554440, partial [Rhizoctonia solani AG-3 Rhs1AP]